MKLIWGTLGQEVLRALLVETRRWFKTDTFNKFWCLGGRTKEESPEFLGEQEYRKRKIEREGTIPSSAEDPV